ncbi:hypothetical protein BH09PLA1_BH09PLA1_35130 [soil metagenome]
MLTTVTLAITMMFAQAIIPTDQKKLTPSKSEVLASIERFMANPGPGEDAIAINKFAEDSKDCLVSVTPNVLTWMNHQPPYKYAGAFFTAFIAGNIKSQLDSGKVADDSHAGLLSVFKVYDTIRARDKEFKASEIDELIAKEKAGELKAWIAKAQEDEKKAEGK